jgi:2-oxoglutarate ferredoxin oxidoreductase subunit delta
MSQPLEAVHDIFAPTLMLPLERVVIAADRCKGCELCIHACAPAVLALDRSRVNALGYNPIHVVAMERCTSCALCARVCPDCVFTVFAPSKGAR